jgi:hypothetical protein
MFFDPSAPEPVAPELAAAGAESDR